MEVEVSVGNLIEPYLDSSFLKAIIALLVGTLLITYQTSLDYKYYYIYYQLLINS